MKFTIEQRVFIVEITAHTANATMVAIREVFEDRIISRGLWPPRSQFLRFLSLGTPKGKSLQE
jgi:hypothetical protein